ncbi:winged helix-turn-helix transcriptional regulator [Candidatus Woesearchaeota archaeon]|nr:winged helix-turn-helix transcriptional regulator [Candidatus Woesearchaeota archaeon]
MEFEELLTKSKWSILKELAKGDKSAVEIARKTSQSTANVTQQLAILEAYGLVKKVKAEKSEKQEKQKKPGKPKTPYSLSQEIFAFSFLKSGMAEKSIIKLREADLFPKFIFNTYFTVNEENYYPLVKYVCESDIIKKADCIAFLQSNEKEIELFVITEQNLHEFREKFSNYHITGLDGKTKKIISWSHNRKEVEEGMGRREEYFINLLKNSKDLIDKKEILAELKQKL